MGALDFSFPAIASSVNNRIGVTFETTPFHTLSMTMKSQLAPSVHNFSLPLLRELYEVMQIVGASSQHWHHQGKIEPIHYAVLQSEHPDYFNLGGDLKHIRRCIREGNGQALLHYSTLCLDLMRAWSTCSDHGMTTIALVQGKALGGGFEVALGADHLIAEAQATFGFPEILFGLFPCSGGMSLLTRRVSVVQAERMMTNGRVYSAAELYDMGVIDEICPKGGGAQAVQKFIANHAKRRAARQLVQRARSRVGKLDFEEMARVVDEWVALALELDNEQLRSMDMLIMMQNGAQKKNIEERLAA